MTTGLAERRELDATRKSVKRHTPLKLSLP
jgi:hypothetical protein